MRLVRWRGSVVWRPTSVNTFDFFLRVFDRATTPAMHLPILISCFIYFLFPLLSSFPHLYHVFPLHCLTTTLLHQMQMVTQSCSHLCSICTSSSLPLSFSMGLWNCQSAVNKADLIPAIASQTAPSILGLTETRKTQQPLLHSLTNSPSLPPPPPPPHTVRLGRVEVLIFSFLTIGNTQLILPYAIIESHAVTVTAPVKLHVVVIYRPPRQLSTFHLHIPRGWQSTCSLWSLQYSFGQPLCCKFPFTPSIIWLKTPYDHNHTQIWQPTRLNLHTQLCCRQRFGKSPTHLWPLLHNI